MDTRPAAGTGRRRSQQIAVAAESHQALHFAFELGRVFVVGICVEAVRMHIGVDRRVFDHTPDSQSEWIKSSAD